MSDKDSQIPDIEETIEANIEAKATADSKENTTEASQDNIQDNIQDNTQDTAEELAQELAQAQQSAKDNWEQILRMRAEMDNVKKRNIRDLENAHKYGLDKFVKELLSVKDSLAMGLQIAQKDGVQVDAIKEGLLIIDKNFTSTLEKFGVAEINPIDERFDPKFHEAMTMIAMPDKASQSVIEVVQVGISLNNRLIRPARVVVAQ